MRIIDRYLLRQFLQVFFICFCSLTGLYVVFDAFSNLDAFISQSEKQGNLLMLMGEYYAYRSLFFFDRTCGILALTSAMFTVTWIQRHNELTALSAAGVPNRRVILPVIIASIVVSLMAAASRELVIPRLRNELGRQPGDLLGDAGQELQPRYDNETDILIRGRYTFANEQRIHRPSFLLPPALNHWGKQIDAQEAYYQPPTAEHPGGYLLDRVIEPRNLATQSAIAWEDRTVIYTPQESKWLKGNQCFVTSNVNFEQLTGGHNWRQFSSTPELIAGLRNRSLDFGADVRVAIHTRFVTPLLDCTLLFLGLPLILRRDNRNMFLAIGMCILVVSVFMLALIGSQHLGSIYLLDPALAAWLPLMIFVPIAASMSAPFRS